MQRFVLAYLKRTDPTLFILSSRARALGADAAIVTARGFTSSRTIFTTLVVRRTPSGFAVLSREDAAAGPPPAGLQGRGATMPVTPAPAFERRRSVNGI